MTSIATFADCVDDAVAHLFLRKAQQKKEKRESRQTRSQAERGEKEQHRQSLKIIEPQNNTLTKH